MILFVFFLLGLSAVLLGDRFLPWLALRAQERVSLDFLFLPVLLALLSGSTILGLYLIPSSSFVLGASVTLLVFRFLSQPVNEDLLRFGFFAAAAVPAFFCIAFLGLRNASVLLQSLRLSGIRAEREAFRVLFLRWIIFAVLLLCFFILYGKKIR